MEKPSKSARPDCGIMAFGLSRDEWKTPPWRMWLIWVLLLGGSCSARAVTFRWSTNSYRIYVTGPGSATLSDIKAALPKVPLTQVAPGVWHLRAELQADNGARLVLHGTKLGGDVNQLRLQSNNTFDTNN